MVQAPCLEEHEITTLSAKRVKALLRAIAGDRFEALHLLVVTTWMRGGELLALRWKDVELKRGVLQVRFVLVRSGNQWVLPSPKMANSRRRIALSQIAKEGLQLHREKQNKEKAMLGDA
jgi:integrase